MTNKKKFVDELVDTEIPVNEEPIEQPKLIKEPQEFIEVQTEWVVVYNGMLLVSANNDYRLYPVGELSSVPPSFTMEKQEFEALLKPTAFNVTINTMFNTNDLQLLLWKFGIVDPQMATKERMRLFFNKWRLTEQQLIEALQKQ